MMGIAGNLFVQGAKPLLVIIAVLYAGGAVSAYFKPGAGEKFEWDRMHAVRGFETAAVWSSLKVYHSISRALRWGLEILEAASADLGEWFMGNRGAHV